MLHAHRLKFRDSLWTADKVQQVQATRLGQNGHDFANCTIRRSLHNPVAFRDIQCLQKGNRAKWHRDQLRAKRVTDRSI